MQRSTTTPSTSTSIAGAAEDTYTGLVDVLVKLHSKYGVRGLFRGALTRVCFFTPSTAITMASYDQLKLLLTQPTSSSSS